MLIGRTFNGHRSNKWDWKIISSARRNKPRARSIVAGQVLVHYNLRGNRNIIYGRNFAMLYTIAVVLVVLWLLGLVTSYTLGGFIHILLVLAIVVVVINAISGRRTV